MTAAPAAVHGGLLVARRLAAAGVSQLFTLSGGHIFPIFDGARACGISLVDVRHEATAVFAAEGWAKVTRTPGVAAVTAGPGVTNAISALAAAQANNSPLVLLAGRAPAGRWGQGSLQEIDHLPLVRPVTKFAATAGSPDAIPGLVDAALAAAMAPPSGPAFVDFPLDVVFAEASEAIPAVAPVSPVAADPASLELASSLLAGAQRPVVMAGTNLYWGFGETALLSLVAELRIPVFLAGQARGCVPADHELAFARTRREALSQADVALLIGAPMDFRLAFGAAFGEECTVIAIDRAPPAGGRVWPRAVAVELYGSLGSTLTALLRAAAAPVPAGRSDWIASLREAETAARAAEEAELSDGRAPLHPMRVFRELAGVLDRDAIVVGDGGDFVSFAGRQVSSFGPGCWLDPGPFGCLGSGLGYALGAKLARPERQVVLLSGDGALGFHGMELDTLARHGVGVVVVVGNNGIWGLEKHPMEWLYGYSVAASLRPGTRYDQVGEALGCRGELVERPEQLGPALRRAFAAGGPAVVNVLTDPGVAYPRRTNLG